MRNQLKELLRNANSNFNGQLVPSDIDAYLDKILDHAEILVEKNNNEIIGFLAMYINKPNLKTAFLSMLFVKEKYRSLGFGKKLIYESMKRAKSHGFQRFDLEVLESNKKAVFFYQALGFDRVSKAGKYILMRRIL